ncbi:hypothetical protein AB0H94_17685 [Streptomyces purpurascens]|uniref:hypothetical protein n=1 Tax=Streptomyces purpurascens TaxID=1924 RepID=UPI0033D4F7A4
MNFNSRHTQSHWWSIAHHEPFWEARFTDAKPFIRSDDRRVSISTIRALESGGLVAREPCPRCLQDERVHLTTDGYQGLTAAFGRPRPPVPTTRPASRPAMPPGGTRCDPLIHIPLHTTPPAPLPARRSQQPAPRQRLRTE